MASDGLIFDNESPKFESTALIGSEGSSSSFPGLVGVAFPDSPRLPPVPTGGDGQDSRPSLWDGTFPGP